MLFFFIDYLLSKHEKLAGYVRDSRVFRVEEISIDHFLVISIIDIYTERKTKADKIDAIAETRTST